MRHLHEPGSAGQELQSSSSGAVGYGLSSKPVTNMNQDALWKATLHAMRNPAECGFKGPGVSVRDMSPTCSAPCAILGKPGSPTVTDNIRVIEIAREITYWPVVNSVESEERQVSTLRTNPLQLGVF